MPSVLDAHHLSTDQLAAAGKAAGRAYVDDPGWAHIIPSETQRARDLPWLMDIALRYGQRFGDVFVSGTPATGAAVWLPPGATTLTPDRLDQVGFLAAPARLGTEAFARFERFVAHLVARHTSLVPEPHWYLMMLGVEPQAQGRGTGHLLMQPLLDRADREGLPCYLETARERNLSFGTRHGFEVVGEADLKGVPRTWLMKRRAKGGR